jgi:alpha-L-fucosidase
MAIHDQIITSPVVGDGSPQLTQISRMREKYLRVLRNQREMLLLLLVLWFTIGTSSLHAQGDEDKEMFNRAKQRDQQAIDEAVKGWWTASMRSHEQRIAWWREAKFGMFIHWGVYSLPGGEWKGKKVSGYAEHLMRKEKISRKEYLALAHEFNPYNFNAEQWILAAKNAGMKYFVITAKHHDGFALYDSKVSEFDLGDQAAFERDPLAELATAAKKHGIRFGFYYSHAFDWEHPDAPGNDWEYNNPGGDKLIGGTSWYDQHPDWLPKAMKYVDAKAIPQIKELIRKYRPDILWFDTPQKLPLSENIRILKAIRETDSTVVVNGRLVRSAGANFGDYKNTADRPAEFYPVTGDWEAIPTTNESYGYHKYDSSHKPAGHFIQLMAKAASKGGNLLMNIGPKGDGAFDKADLDILNGIGKWMNKNGESIYGTNAGTLPLQNWGVVTTKGNKNYLHVFDWPSNGKLFVGGLATMPDKIYPLTDPGRKLEALQLSSGDISITVPLKAPDTVNTVIVLEYKARPPAEKYLYCISPGIPVSRLLAFDAIQHGAGFKYGDGKRDKYYVEGWQKHDQSLSWKIKTIKPGAYNLLVKYIAPEESSGGEFTVAIDEHKAGKSEEKYLLPQPVVTANKNTTVVTRNIGIVTLDQGLYEITISPRSFGKNELMKLLELQLIPLDK